MWIPSPSDSVNVQLRSWLLQAPRLWSRHQNLPGGLLPEAATERQEGQNAGFQACSRPVAFHLKFCVYFETYRKRSGESITAIQLCTEVCGLQPSPRISDRFWAACCIILLQWISLTVLRDGWFNAGPLGQQLQIHHLSCRGQRQTTHNADNGAVWQDSEHTLPGCPIPSPSARLATCDLKTPVTSWGTSGDTSAPLFKTSLPLHPHSLLSSQGRAANVTEEITDWGFLPCLTEWPWKSPFVSQGLSFLFGIMRSLSRCP